MFVLCSCELAENCFEILCMFKQNIKEKFFSALNEILNLVENSTKTKIKVLRETKCIIHFYVMLTIFNKDMMTTGNKNRFFFIIFMITHFV